MTLIRGVCPAAGHIVRAEAVGAAEAGTEVEPSVAAVPNERWSTDLARIQAGKDGWATLALVMSECHTREMLGWRLSRSGKATSAVAALEHSLIARFGTLGRVETSFLLRSDNGLVLTSRAYSAMARSYGLRQEFITPYCPQRNGMMQRLIRSLEEQCVHRRRFERLTHADRTIGDWIGFNNNRRPHKALGVRTPAAAVKLATQPDREALGRYIHAERRRQVLQRLR